MIIFGQIFLGAMFLFISLLSFTFIGFPILKKIKINLEDETEKFVLSSVFGMVVFTLSAYILAALNLRFLMWLVPMFGILMFVKFKDETISLIPKVSNKTFFLLVFIAGIIGQVAVNAPSGFPYQNGIYFTVLMVMMVFGTWLLCRKCIKIFFLFKIPNWPEVDFKTIIFLWIF